MLALSSAMHISLKDPGWLRLRNEEEMISSLLLDAEFI